MATAHPTTEPDGEFTVDDADGARDDGARPGVGIHHPTVVPTNFDEDD